MPDRSAPDTTGYWEWIAVGIVMTGLSVIWFWLFYDLIVLVVVGIVWQLTTWAIVIGGCRATYEDRHPQAAVSRQVASPPSPEKSSSGMSMAEWARVAVPYTTPVDPMTQRLRDLADGRKPDALRVTASRLIDLVDEIEANVPVPPDADAAPLWKSWLFNMRLGGEEFIRGVSVTHKLQPAADYMQEATEQLRALNKIIRRERVRGRAGPR
jgi:hypothetical protein